jgi:MFS transporter
MSQDEARRSAIAKAGRRLLPFLCLCYAVNFLDRVNVGFAALAMNDDLSFSPSVFGVGAGIFFAGYILFEVPSNLAMQKFGARIWIARIMISWGLAIAMAFVSGERSFYALRFLLGVAEAGFFPGIILYLTYWFPARERARIVALFMAAVPLDRHACRARWLDHQRHRRSACHRAERRNPSRHLGRRQQRTRGEGADRGKGAVSRRSARQARQDQVRFPQELCSHARRRPGTETADRNLHHLRCALPGPHHAGDRCDWLERI